MFIFSLGTSFILFFLFSYIRAPPMNMISCFSFSWLSHSEDTFVTCLLSCGSFNDLYNINKQRSVCNLLQHLPLVLRVPKGHYDCLDSLTSPANEPVQVCNKMRYNSLPMPFSSSPTGSASRKTISCDLSPAGMARAFTASSTPLIQVASFILGISMWSGPVNVLSRLKSREQTWNTRFPPFYPKM